MVRCKVCMQDENSPYHRKGVQLNYHPFEPSPAEPVQEVKAIGEDTCPFCEKPKHEGACEGYKPRPKGQPLIVFEPDGSVWVAKEDYDILVKGEKFYIEQWEITKAENAKLVEENRKQSERISIMAEFIADEFDRLSKLLDKIEERKKVKP